MEIWIVGGLILTLLGVSVFGYGVIWLLLLGFGIYVGRSTRRLRCPGCHKHPLPLENVDFCPRCGKSQLKTANSRKRLALAFWIALFVGAITSYSGFRLGLSPIGIFRGQSGLWTILSLGIVFLGVWIATFWLSAHAMGQNIRLRCHDCRKMLRNELSVHFCGRCGEKQ